MRANSSEQELLSFAIHDGQRTRRMGQSGALVRSLRDISQADHVTGLRKDSLCTKWASAPQRHEEALCSRDYFRVSLSAIASGRTRVGCSLLR